MSGKRRKVILATLPDGSFGSAGASWKSLSISKIIKGLDEAGNSVQVASVDKLLLLELSESDIVIYASSDEAHMRAFLRDQMYIVSKKCSIVPAYECLLAHENKGFQQIYRADQGFGSLSGNYIFDFDDLPREYPFVYKATVGAGSSQVRLIKSDSDRRSLKKKYFNLSLKRRLIRFFRWLHLSKDEYQIYAYRHKGFGLAVFQPFIQGLIYDYKILVFGKRYFVLKRNVRRNDFRASGSGDFNFVEPPHTVLDFSKKIFSHLNSPYASLDIAESENGCQLIEYQCLNFGPYTVINAPGHFVYSNNKWDYISGKVELDLCFSSALSDYIEKLS